MAKKKTARSDSANGACRGSNNLLDVVVVILEGGYTSTAVAPIEIFHAAGVVWNWLHGEPVKPRFRVRTASIDGRSVKSICALGATNAPANVHRHTRADPARRRGHEDHDSRAAR
jgi:hypothetical protein